VTVRLSGGAGSPSNTMWPGPRPTSVPNGILIHLAIDMDHGFVRKPRKRGRVAVALSMGEIGLHLTMWHGLRPTSVPLPSGILMHPAVWLQETWAKIGGCALLGRGARFPANTEAEAS